MQRHSRGPWTIRRAAAVPPVLPFLCLAALVVLGACSRVSGGDVDKLGNAARGQQLLAQYQCGGCHEIPDVPGARAGIGPPLSKWGRRSYIAGHLPNTPALLQRWIMNPEALVPGSLMPAMGAGEADARDMVAYLMSLR